MKKLIMRRLSRVADSAQYSLLRKERRRERRRVEEGHVPVFVGEEMERFVVSAELLNRPIFVELLEQSAQEYGYEQKGDTLHCLFIFKHKELHSGHSDTRFCAAIRDSHVLDCRKSEMVAQDLFASARTQTCTPM
ncbi:hypothetical protein Sjap_002743 [Stephania japonica]|uniref:Uncharacterized protein n=1 Tax=Stephania japonica TaxID=461633 RepID=A0AAP0KMG6_9MAGN